MTKIISKFRINRHSPETLLMGTESGTVQTWAEWLDDWRRWKGIKKECSEEKGKLVFPFSDLEKYLCEVECAKDEKGKTYWKEVK